MIKALNKNVEMSRVYLMFFVTLMSVWSMHSPRGMSFVIVGLWILVLVGCYLEDKFKRRKK
jgi:ABC-type xylose transport system permease subunit